MALIDIIKADYVRARVAKSGTVGLLSALVGEIETKTKTFNPARGMSDEEVMAVVSKFLKGNAEATGFLGRLPEDRRAVEADKLAAERAALSTYLPSQMSEADIEAFARDKAAQGMNMGAIMGALKAEKGAASYDGKLASTVVKRALG